MVFRTAILLSLFLLASCQNVNVYKMGEDVHIDIRIIETRMGKYEGQEKQYIGKEIMALYLKIYEFSDMPGIINEIHMPYNRKLVEYFDTPDGTFQANQRDKHSTIGLTGTQKRYIYTYPAEVTGVDATASGFAELPQNLDGSVVTNVDPNLFNKEHNDAHDRKGMVVRDERNKGRWWSVHYDGSSKKIRFTLDDRPHWAVDTKD